MNEEQPSASSATSVHPGRRAVIGTAAAAAGAIALGVSSRAAAEPVADRPKRPSGRTRVFLLGTAGGPGASPGLDGDRTGIGSYVEVDGVGYVVDCGTGTLRSLHLLDLDTAGTQGIFITHLHSDHTYDYGSILYNKWARRVVPRWDTYGPTDLGKLTDDAHAYFATDADSRYSEGGYPARWRREFLNVSEFAADGPVMAAAAEGGAVIRSDERVTVTATPVNHPPLPSVAFRFDTPDVSVVFSGDTAPNDALWRLAEGADILVHEAIDPDAVREAVDNEEKLAHILGTHSTPQQAGETAAMAGVETLVLNHLWPGDHRIVRDNRWRKLAAETFDGHIVVGRDLMQVV